MSLAREQSVSPEPQGREHAGEPRPMPSGRPTQKSEVALHKKCRRNVCWWMHITWRLGPDRHQVRVIFGFWRGWQCLHSASTVPPPKNLGQQARYLQAGPSSVAALVRVIPDNSVPCQRERGK